MEEKCLDCKWCEVIEESGNGFIGESIFRCKISEEETENMNVLKADDNHISNKLFLLWKMVCLFDIINI